MKFSRLQFCFCSSLLFHAVLFGGLAMVAANLRRPRVLPEAEPLVLNLVAASEEPALEPAQRSVVVAAAVPEPPPKPPEAETLKQFPLLVEPAAPTLATAPVPLPAASVPTQAVRTVVAYIGGSTNPVLVTVPAAVRNSVPARPDYLKNPEPAYPLAARRRRQEGLVLLAVTVTPQGRTARLEVKQSSGFSLLDQAAVQAVRDWEFEPARIGPIAVASEIEVPVRFKLDN